MGSAQFDQLSAPLLDEMARGDNRSIVRAENIDLQDLFECFLIDEPGWAIRSAERGIIEPDIQPPEFLERVCHQIPQAQPAAGIRRYPARLKPFASQVGYRPADRFGMARA